MLAVILHLLVVFLHWVDPPILRFEEMHVQYKRPA